MKVKIVGVNVVTGSKAKRVKNLASKRIMNRQDGIDGQDFNAGPNRGLEHTFTKKGF